MSFIKTPKRSLLSRAAATSATSATSRTSANMPRCIAAALDPQTLIEQMLHAFQCDALRRFLAAVVAEHEVKVALTQVTRSSPQQMRTSVIARLRRAGDIAAFWSAHAAERETLFVATFMRGVQELIGAQVVGNTCTPSDVTFAIVRSALHRLDDQAPAQSRLLRLALGWGNEDEVDAVYVPRIQHTVRQSLRSV